MPPHSHRPASQGTVGLGVHQPGQFPHAQLDPPPISHPGPAQRSRLDVVDGLVVRANLLAAQASSSPSLHPAPRTAAPAPAKRMTVSFRVGRTAVVASAPSSPTADAHHGQRLETPPKTMSTYGSPEKPQVNEGFSVRDAHRHNDAPASRKTSSARPRRA